MSTHLADSFPLIIGGGEIIQRRVLIQNSPTNGPGMFLNEAAHRVAGDGLHLAIIMNYGRLRDNLLLLGDIVCRQIPVLIVFLFHMRYDLLADRAFDDLTIQVDDAQVAA